MSILKVYHSKHLKKILINYSHNVEKFKILKLLEISIPEDQEVPLSLDFLLLKP
jgi:hypothetical protein